ncbi:unnamed protein product [Schistosoma mattheei]|uniref:Uncharacterized protein n=1 Tax=Schistosoma mattheei TaxID=31246 RepID=A0A183Q626_9TREM|nr:unnamed protein product [Schistosoma mattheei]
MQNSQLLLTSKRRVCLFHPKNKSKNQKVKANYSYRFTS